MLAALLVRPQDRVVVRGGGFVPLDGRAWVVLSAGNCARAGKGRCWLRDMFDLRWGEGFGEMRLEMKYLAMIMGGDCGRAAVGWRTNRSTHFWKV